MQKKVPFFFLLLQILFLSRAGADVSDSVLNLVYYENEGLVFRVICDATARPFRDCLTKNPIEVMLSSDFNQILFAEDTVRGGFRSSTGKNWDQTDQQIFQLNESLQKFTYQLGVVATEEASYSQRHSENLTEIGKLSKRLERAGLTPEAKSELKASMENYTLENRGLESKLAVLQEKKRKLISDRAPVERKISFEKNEKENFLHLTVDKLREVSKELTKIQSYSLEQRSIEAEAFSTPFKKPAGVACTMASIQTNNRISGVRVKVSGKWNSRAGGNFLLRVKWNRENFIERIEDLPLFDGNWNPSVSPSAPSSYQLFTLLNKKWTLLRCPFSE